MCFSTLVVDDMSGVGIATLRDSSLIDDEYVGQIFNGIVVTDDLDRDDFWRPMPLKVKQRIRFHQL